MYVHTFLSIVVDIQLICMFNALKKKTCQKHLDLITIPQYVIYILIYLVYKGMKECMNWLFDGDPMGSIPKQHHQNNKPKPKSWCLHQRWHEHHHLVFSKKIRFIGFEKLKKISTFDERRRFIGKMATGTLPISNGGPKNNQPHKHLI